MTRDAMISRERTWPTTFAMWYEAYSLHIYVLVKLNVLFFFFKRNTNGDDRHRIWTDVFGVMISNSSNWSQSAWKHYWPLLIKRKLRTLQWWTFLVPTFWGTLLTVQAYISHEMVIFGSTIHVLTFFLEMLFQRIFTWIEDTYQ